MGPEVLVTLDRDSAVPLRAQLEDQFRTAIRSGRLGPGERLPSSRTLAQALGLSRGLVQECYAQLQAEGYLNARGGSATRVSSLTAPAAEPLPTSTRSLAPPTSLALPASAARSLTPPACTRSLAPPRLIADFASGVPDLGLLPREDWAWAVREACRSAPNSAFDYGDPQGYPRLREVIAAYLRRVRAVDASAGQIVISSGMAQGQWLVLQTLASRGVRRVAFEDPGSPANLTHAARLGSVQAVPVPVDEFGVDVAALEATGAGAVVITPAHQWPTGVVLAPERRLALLDWAARRGGMIIEDDYDAEFRYDREAVGTLQGLAPDRVVALGTVSKSLAPALRLGWMVCPPALTEDMWWAKRVTDRGSPGIDQLALATLIESGRYDRHLRRMRAEYAARRDVLVRALAEHAPRVRLTGLAAGFHAVAHLPAGTSEPAVIEAARARSVALYGMSRHRHDNATDPPQLVLGFGNLGQRAIRAGVAAVADHLA